MAQTSKRGAAPATQKRTASCPAGVGERRRCSGAQPPVETKSPAHSLNAALGSGYSVEANSSPVSGCNGSGNSSVSTAAGGLGGCRTPNQRSTTNHLEADLRHEEDFVEGGIELPTAPEGGADGGLPCDEDPPVLTTRPLPPLGDRALEEFWPRGNGPRALFLDYDGTLREFEARPELAVPTQEIKELLAAINARPDFSPHIISGRDARFLETNFGSLDRFTLIAEHGFQIWRPGVEGWQLWDHPDGLDKDHDDWKAIVRAEMTDFVNATPGSHIEEKASSLVWHYREVADASRGEEAASQAMERLEEVRNRNNIGKIRISHGHKVVEVSYRKVRKGPVMRRICEEKALFGEPFLSVFVAGDDTSDESMFDIAPDDFLTVKVGPALTHAKFRVDSPEQLRKFLWHLTA